MTKTKPETKEGMAEWLAVEVLGLEHRPLMGGERAYTPIGNPPPHDSWILDIDEYIYSPDGFFAVKQKIFTIGYQFYRVWPIWDERGEGLQVGIGEDYTKAKIYTGNYYYPKTGNDKEDLCNIKAEIEAFCNAVYEAMNDSNL